MHSKIFIGIILSLCSQMLIGQNLSISFIDKEREAFESLKALEKEYPDKASMLKSLAEFVDDLHQASFLTASLDSFIIEEDQAKAIIFVGNSFSFVDVKPRGVPLSLINDKSIARQLNSPVPLPFMEFSELKRNMLLLAENNGYPFASVRLDSIFLDGETISGILAVDRGERIIIDSIKVSGDIDVNPNFLSRYLEIPIRSLYSQEKILDIKKRLSELPYLELKGDPTVRFIGNYASIDIPVQKRKSSRFDFVVGFIPKTEPGQRFGISGEFLSEFYNSFGAGERIFINLKRLKPQTQELKLAFSYPYLFQLPFAVEFDFDLFRLDSMYTNVNYSIGFRYLLGGNNYLSASWKNNSAFTQYVDLDLLEQNKTLPSIIDIRKNSLALSYYLEKLDYRFNPRSGYEINLGVSVGQKEILKNIQITDYSDGSTFDYNSLYDSLALKTFQWNVHADFAYFIPIGQRSTFMFQLESAILSRNHQLFENELYRIGGNRTLRGFDEQSILTSFYAKSTIEYRYLIGQNAFIGVFSDIGYVELEGEDESYDVPFGFGAGINFETALGVFGFSYALGSRKAQPLNFRQSKIHFGYINLF